MRKLLVDLVLKYSAGIGGWGFLATILVEVNDRFKVEG